MQIRVGRDWGNDENDDPDYNGDNMEDFDEESNNGIHVYDL